MTFMEVDREALIVMFADGSTARRRPLRKRVAGLMPQPLWERDVLVDALHSMRGVPKNTPCRGGGSGR